MWSQGEPTCGYSIIWTYIINQLYIEMLGERCFCFVFSSRSSKQCTVCLTPYHTYIYTLHMWIIGIEVIVMDMKREDVRDTIKNHWRLVLLMASTIRCVQTERNKTHIARPRHVRFNVSSFNNEIEPRSESIEWVRWSMRWPEKWSTTIWKPFVSHTSQHNTLIVMMKCLLRNSMDTKSLLSWRFYNNFSWLIFSTAILLFRSLMCSECFEKCETTHNNIATNGKFSHPICISMTHIFSCSWWIFMVFVAFVHESSSVLELPWPSDVRNVRKMMSMIDYRTFGWCKKISRARASIEHQSSSP